MHGLCDGLCMTVTEKKKRKMKRTKIDKKKKHLMNLL